MRVSLAEIQGYAKTLARLSDVAAERANFSIALWMTMHPEADVAECREFAIAAVGEAVERYGDAAASEAAALYDEVMEAEGVDVPPAQIYEGAEQGAIEGTVRRLAGRLASDAPDRAGFAEQAGALAADMTRRAASETVMANVGRDSKTRRGKGVRFARVPQRIDPCAYCMMLASRGFVYRSRQSAAAASHHRCTCLVVPGVEGKTRVEGYDPDEYYDLWRTSGFMPTTRRGVMRADVASGTRRSTSRRRTEEGNLSGTDLDAIRARLNSAAEKGRGALDAEWTKLYEEMESRGSHYKDVDFQRVGDHYGYLLEELRKDRYAHPEVREAVNASKRERYAEKRSGAISGAIRGDRKRELEHAERYYEQVRNRDRDSVLERLAKESDLSLDEMRRAFNHLLIEEHELDDGRHRFYPDYEMSQSMQRLLSGERVQTHDRIMFAHEHLESLYMEQGHDQRTAHEMANLRYDYERSLNEWLESGAKL